MDGKNHSLIGWFFGSLFRYMRRLLFGILSMGVIPKHVAFILDGNRRYAKKMKIPYVVGYRAAFFTLLCILKYCYELGVKYVSIYAFSIENFKRRPDEVQCLMDLMLNKVEGLLKYQTVLHHYGVRLHFVGNLKLLDDRLKLAAEKAMEATRMNSGIVLLVCVAYTSTDEIVHAVQAYCEEKTEERGATVVDMEEHMYMGVAPEVDVLVRTSGETRLSNFLLWQTSKCLLYSPKALFPEIGLWHLVWAVLNFQRVHHYLHKEGKLESI